MKRESALTIETTTAPQKADIKSTTENPLIRVETNQKNTALIKIENKPKVRMLIGKVTTSKIGLIVICIIDKTNPAINAGTIPCKNTPPTKYAAAITESVNITIRNNNFIAIKIKFDN
jgi:hypothetical protein